MPLVRVPATTANLGPGFDTLGMALKLYDEISIEKDTSLKITITGEGEATIPRGPENIAYRAALSVFQKAGYPETAFRIRMYNKIPVARGLGSSAAALVGGLIGANTILGNPLGQTELIELATAIEGHPDNVAPAILGALVVSVKDNQQVYCQRLEPPPGLTMAIAIPQFTLSTRVSRSVLPTNVLFEDAVFNISRVGMMLAAIQAGNLELMGKMMGDRLHQPYRLPLIPGMNEVFAAAKDAGALAVTLSGSGPTVIAFCKGSQPEVGLAMEAAFDHHGVKATVRELSPCLKGAIVL